MAVDSEREHGRRHKGMAPVATDQLPRGFVDCCIAVDRPAMSSTNFVDAASGLHLAFHAIGVNALRRKVFENPVIFSARARISGDFGFSAYAMTALMIPSSFGLSWSLSQYSSALKS